MVKLKTWFQSRAVQFYLFHHKFLNKVNVVLIQVHNSGDGRFPCDLSSLSLLRVAFLRTSVNNSFATQFGYISSLVVVLSFCFAEPQFESCIQTLLHD